MVKELVQTISLRGHYILHLIIVDSYAFICDMCYCDSNVLCIFEEEINLKNIIFSKTKPFVESDGLTL